MVKINNADKKHSQEAFYSLLRGLTTKGEVEPLLQVQK
jgi:hypothetical protein